MSINLLQANTTLSSNGSHQAQATSATNAENSEDSPATGNTNAETSISTRAEKLQKLSKEFFPSGPKSLEVSPEFVQRLQEYGFISGPDAEKLSAQLKQLSQFSETSTASPQSNPQSVAQLETFTDTLSEKLKKSSPGNSLIDLLNEAKSALQSFDKSQTSDKQTNYKNLINKLSEFSNSTDTNLLTADEKDGLNTLAITLSVADKLGPAKSTTNEINQYLSILKR